MKYVFISLLGILLGGVGWRIGGNLSSDAMGMAIGMLFGIMAGIPTVLLVLAAQQRPDDRHDMRPQRARPQIEAKPVQPQINNYITNNHYHEAPGRNRRAEVEARNMLPGPAPEMPAQRQFRMVNEHEEGHR